MSTATTTPALTASATAIIETAQKALPDLPLELYLTGAKGVVLSNTLRSLQDLGRKPRFRPQPVTVVLAVTANGHEIRVGKDGNVYCTCGAWRFQKIPASLRTCKHIKEQFGIV